MLELPAIAMSPAVVVGGPGGDGGVQGLLLLLYGPDNSKVTFWRWKSCSKKIKKVYKRPRKHWPFPQGLPTLAKMIRFGVD